MQSTLSSPGLLPVHSGAVRDFITLNLNKVEAVCPVLLVCEPFLPCAAQTSSLALVGPHGLQLGPDAQQHLHATFAKWIASPPSVLCCQRMVRGTLWTRMIRLTLGALASHSA